MYQQQPEKSPVGREIPPSVKPVIFVRGSWYEMGFQFGETARQAVRIKVPAGLAVTIQMFGSRSAALRALEAYMDAVAEKAPELLQLWNGIADGAGQSREDVYLAYTNFMACSDRCSNLSAWGSATEDGRLLCGMNCDEPELVNFYAPTVIAYPDDGYAFISASAFTCNCYMNEKGLVMMGSGGECEAEGDRAPGLPNAVSLMLCAAHCATAEEARDKICREKSGPGSGEHIHMADISGSAFVIEHTARRDRVRAPGELGEKDYILATNTFLTPEMQCSVPKGAAANQRDYCLTRYWTEERIMLENFGVISPDVVNRALGCKGYYIRKNWAYSEWHTEVPYRYGWTEDGWNTADEIAFQTGQWTPEKRSPFSTCVFSAIMDPEKGSFYITNGCRDTLLSRSPNATGNFVHLRLCPDELSVIDAAKEDAQIKIYYAGLDLEQEENTSRCKYLKAAKSQLLRGINWHNLAICAHNGAQRRLCCNHAASAYMQAQALGQLAQNADSAYTIEGRGGFFKKGHNK